MKSYIAIGTINTVVWAGLVTFLITDGGSGRLSPGVLYIIMFVGLSVGIAYPFWQARTEL